MYQVDGQYTAPTLQQPAGTAGITPADPASTKFWQDTSTPGTQETADWFNMVQEELLNLVRGAGIAPLKNVFNQVLASVNTLIAAALAAYTPPSSFDPGDVIMTGAAAAGAGWLLCQGQAVSRTTYAALFAAIGTEYGAGDGATTFNVPQMQGYFPRGYDASGAVDPGRTLGSTQADAFASHNHRSGIGAGAGSEEPFVYGGTALDCPGDATLGQVHADNIATAVQGLTSTVGATETRPKNVSFNFKIKT